MTDTTRVILWARDIGAVTWLPDRGLGVFQYTPEFARSGIEVAPMMMPLTDIPYEFPSLSRETFKGLPGLLADSLPDKFGSALINAWLSSRGREPGSFTPVEAFGHPLPPARQRFALPGRGCIFESRSPLTALPAKE